MTQKETMSTMVRHRMASRNDEELERLRWLRKKSNLLMGSLFLSVRSLRFYIVSYHEGMKSNSPTCDIPLSPAIQMILSLKDTSCDKISGPQPEKRSSSYV